VTGDEKDQADFRVGLDVAIAVEEFVSCNIGNEQLLLVQNFHETRGPAFWRSIAIAIAVACRHHTKRRMADKVLIPRSHSISDFACCAGHRIAEFFLILSLHGVLVRDSLPDCIVRVGFDSGLQIRM